MRKTALIALLCCILALNTVSSTKAANIVSNNFPNGSGFSSISGLSIGSNKAILGNDGVNLTENFNSYSNGAVPTNWSRETTDWQVDSQTYSNLTNNYDDSRTFYNLGLKNGVFQADLSLLGGEQLGGLIFREQDNQNYYVFSFSSLYDFVAISKIVGGSSTTIQSIGENYDPNTYYTLKVIFNGTNIKAYMNNVLKFDINDGTFGNSGKVGFWRNGTGMRTENVSITSSTYSSGYAESITHTQAQNIRSVSTSLTGTNLPKVNVLVSNNNGTDWVNASNGSQVYFKSAGTNFKYKIYLNNDTTAPELKLISFSLTLGTTLVPSYSKSPEATQLHYNSFGTGIANTSLNPANLSSTGSVSNMKVVQQSSIVLKNGKYIAYLPNSYNNTLVAYNLGDNQVLWTKNLAGFIESTPYVKDNVIYFGDYGPTFYAVDQDTGNTLWTYTPVDAISGGNIDSNDTLVFFTDYGYGGTSRLYAVNKTTHALAWSFSVAATTFVSYSLDKSSDIIYVGGLDQVSALKASTGALIWNNPLGTGYITNQPVITEDKLVIGSDQAIVVLNRFDGSLIWNQSYPGAEQGVGAAPAVINNTVYYPTKGDAKVYAKNLDTGAAVWTNNLGVGTFSSPVITEDGYIYISYNDGMRAFSLANGNLVWTSPQASWNENNASLAYGYLLYTTPAGNGTLNISKTSQIQSLSSQDSTYKIIFDDAGSGYITNTTRSVAGDYILIGGFESFDVGYGNDAGTYKIKSGVQPTWEANVSQVGLLANVDSTIPLYDRLLFKIDPSGNPTSADGARFAVQIAPDSSFATFNYVNPSTFSPDIVTNPNLSTYYQPCAQTTSNPADSTRWDCGNVSGLKRYIQGLAPITNYCVRIVAMNGDATNSEPGPSVCQTTQSMVLTLIVSPNSSNFGILSTNSVTTASPSTTITSSTNVNSGYIVKVSGRGSNSGTISGLYSPSNTHLIASTAGNLDASIGAEGYGLQTSIQTGGSEITLDNAYDPTLSGRNTTFVGQILRTTANLYTTIAPNSGTHEVRVNYLANISTSTPAGADYTDLITYTINANW